MVMSVIKLLGYRWNHKSIYNNIYIIIYTLMEIIQPLKSEHVNDTHDHDTHDPLSTIGTQKFTKKISKFVRLSASFPFARQDKRAVFRQSSELRLR